MNVFAAVEGLAKDRNKSVEGRFGRGVARGIYKEASRRGGDKEIG